MKKILNLLIATFAVFVAGCAGQKFSPVTAVPTDKALVYVYRKSSISGVLGSHLIFANLKPVASLSSGSYFPYFADPDTNYLSSHAYSVSPVIDASMNAQFKNRVCEVDAEAGKTYYVQFNIATSWGPKMTQVDAETGAKEIQKCSLAKPIK